MNNQEEQLEKILDKYFKKHINPLLTKKMRESITKYTHETYNEMYIRTILYKICMEYPDRKEKIEELLSYMPLDMYGVELPSSELEIFDKAINLGKLPTNITTYRGTSKNLFELTTIKDKNTIIPLTWWSTTIKKKEAYEKISFFKDIKKLILEFHLPKDFVAFYTAPLSHFGYEKELILPSKTPFECTCEKEEDNVKKLILIPK